MDSNLNFLYALLVVILIVSLALMTRSCSTPRVPPPFDVRQTLEGAARESAQMAGVAGVGGERGARGARGGRPILALFTADWCPACQKFKGGALASSRVQNWIEMHTVPVYVDATRANSGDTELQALLTRYRVTELPTLMILEPGRLQDERARLVGNKHRREVLAWLEKVAP
jgi:thiol:disulfide interchange protein